MGDVFLVGGFQRWDGVSRAAEEVGLSLGMPVSTWRRLQFRNPPDVERRCAEDD
jgi:hypothetical protein